MTSKLTKIPLMIGTATVLIAGCGKLPESNDKAFFPERDDRHALLMAERQAEIGAAKDGTLYAFHFDGDELNSLGRQKLGRIDRGTSPAADLTIYVDIDIDDDATDARKASVAAYLDTLGVPVDRIAMNDGPNPRTHSVAKTLKAEAAGDLGPAGNDTGGIGGATGGGETPQKGGPL
ncbi:MAG: hypothetical protein AAGD32_04350 [Planctomycetota bacterium]